MTNQNSGRSFEFKIVVHVKKKSLIHIIGTIFRSTWTWIRFWAYIFRAMGQ